MLKLNKSSSYVKSSDRYDHEFFQNCLDGINQVSLKFC